MNTTIDEVEKTSEINETKQMKPIKRNQVESQFQIKI